MSAAGTGVRAMFTRIKRLLPGGEFTRNVAVLAGGTALGQGLLVLASPILTRLYTPDDMGKWGIFTSFAGLSLVIVSLRYELAITAAKEDREAAYLSLGAIITSAILSAAACVVFLLLVRSDAMHFGTLSGCPIHLVYFWLVAGSSALAVRYWLVREQEFSSIGKAAFFRNGSRAVAQVALGATPLGWIGLPVGDFFGRAISLLPMVRRAEQRLTQLLKPISLRFLARTLSRFRGFPLAAVPSSLANTAAVCLTIPLVARLYGTEAAGCFMLAQQVVGLPMGLIINSTADVFQGHAGSCAREAPDRVAPLFYRTARALLFLGLGPATLLFLIGPWLFALVFGVKWRLSGELAAVMAPRVLAQLVVGPLSRLVFVMERQALKLVYDVAALASVGAAFFIAWRYGASLVTCVAMLAGFQVLAYCIYFAILAMIVRGASRRKA